MTDWKSLRGVVPLDHTPERLPSLHGFAQSERLKMMAAKERVKILRSFLEFLDGLKFEEEHDG